MTQDLPHEAPFRLVSDPEDPTERRIHEPHAPILADDHPPRTRGGRYIDGPPLVALRAFQDDPRR